MRFAKPTKPWYPTVMTGVKDNIKPSATPSEEEIRRWNDLPRDEQLERMREALLAGEQSGISERTMDDIKAAAQKRLAELRTG